MRALSGMERVWLAADRLGPPFAIQLVLEGEAPLDEGDDGLSLDALQAAVDQAAAAWPGFSIRLTGALGWTRWTAGPPPRVRAVDGSAWSGRDPEGALFLSAPIDARRGPVAEVLLVDGRPQRLVIRAHHAAADGRGFMGFASDLLRALDGAPCRGGEGGPTTDLELAVAAAVAPAEPLARDCAAPTGEVGAPEQQTLTRWYRVTAPTPPGRSLARLVRALWRSSRLWTEGPLRLDLPVDLRRHRPGLASSANLSGLLRLKLSADPELDDLQQWIREALAAREELRPVRAAAGVRWLPLWLMAASGRAGTKQSLSTGRYEISATVSSLGRAELACDRWPVARAWIVPPASPGLPLLMTAVAGQRGLEICATAPCALASDGRLEALLDGIALQLSAR